jgi:excisionase family DNA binding protein
VPEKVELFTVDETAKALHLSPWTIRQWIASRRLGSVRLGNRAIRVPGSEITRLIKVGFTPSRAECE